MQFDDTITQLTSESSEISDIPRNTLDPEVFQFFDDGSQPILRDGIRAQILQGLQHFSEIIQINAFYLIGDILTRNWVKKTPINVYIETDAEMLDNISTAELLFSLNRHNGKLAVGTIHPVNFHIIPGQIDSDDYEAIYEIANERWLKNSVQLNPEIEHFITRFNETLLSIEISGGSIQRNLINLNDLEDYDRDTIQQIRFEVQKKVDRIDSDINHMLRMYADNIDKSADVQILASDPTSTISEILYYSKQYRLSEAFTLNLLKRHYIHKFIKRLDGMLTEGTDFNIEQLVSSSVIGRMFRSA